MRNKISRIQFNKIPSHTNKTLLPKIVKVKKIKTLKTKKTVRVLKILVKIKIKPWRKDLRILDRDF